ncbi:BTB/POZ domain-containing protein 9-like isoform X2 [Xenia sp. Carnegie-2017]|uniref:BTB/POZ domain-containing protein 9-like isoform X2 n=1 Tax=Xenia sp. Carnegie-2017 TaxID=2897299 RepID=UPI001F036169|nr:BTB/POZ domain-containing protein 9-like isoform X2 [Xenia sp. Carnegie-2017]
MADCPKFRSNSFSSNSSLPSGEVDHVELLSSQLAVLLQSSEFTDVTFIVEDKSFPAHRAFLASRCEYFRALLYGGMRESWSQREIVLNDISARSFDSILKYIYTGRVHLRDLGHEHVLDLLGLAHKYGFLALESAISGYLKGNLDLHSIWGIFDVACLYQLDEVLETCLTFADMHAVEILRCLSEFSSLSEAAVVSMVKRDSFCAPEIDIFRAIQCWIVENPDTDKKVTSYLRLSLISLHDLFHIVKPSGLFTADDILDAIQVQTESQQTQLKFRGHLDLDENVALPHLGAEVIEGEFPEALLDLDTTSFDMDKGFTLHYLEEGRSITIRLGRPTIINTIKLLLWDRDMRSYSYCIEVSMDNVDWLRIIDYSKYLCHSWQTLYFKARVVRYVRLIGTHNTVNRIFHVVHFECMFSSQTFEIGEDNIIIPRENVASTQVVFGRWFVLLLWDCDDRTYSYYIEVSNDRQNWEIVSDCTKEECRSWQTAKFSPRIVTFIRITGTRNSVNEVFHCVHFECPASVIKKEKAKNGKSNK